MRSSSNKITRREEVNELFEQLGQVLGQRVEGLLIGGAVMPERGGQGEAACLGQSLGLSDSRS